MGIGDLSNSEMDYVNRIEEYIDIDDFDNLTELRNELLKHDKTNKQLQSHLDILGRYLGIKQTGVQGKKGKRKTVTIKGNEYIVKSYITKKENVFVKIDVVIIDVGRKKKMIRNVQTGRIVGWTNEDL